MADIAQDFRYALRTLGRNRLLSGVVIATLALGIGATTAIYSVVDGLLLRPLPFPEADRLVVALEVQPSSRGRMTVSWPSYQDWAANARSFDGITAHRGMFFNLTGLDVAEPVDTRAVGGGFFGLLGTSAQVGRLIGRDDDRPSAPEVAVISDRLWRRRFDGDPAALGRSLILDGRPYAIVGVLPPGFQYSRVEDVFVPLAVTLGPADEDRGNHTGILALARRAPGVTLEEARTEMEGIAAALAREYPNSNSGVGVEVHSLRSWLFQDVRTPLLVLMAGVGCLLLIACVNLANLLLARGAAREGEVAVRLALGAGRWRIARQLLAESLLLALAGGALGAVLAGAGLPLLQKWLPTGIPRLETVALDGRVLAVALGLSIATGLAFGVLPALQAARGGLAGAARTAARRTAAGLGAGGRLRRVLLVAEIGLAVVLLTAAGLMMRTFQELVAVDPGFRSERLLTLRFQLRGERYDAEESRVAASDRILERMRALPGVEAAGLTISLPLAGSNWGSVFIVGDQPVPPRADLPSAAFNPVSPGYFETVGMRLLRGRPFESGDRPDSQHVAVINETMARHFWPGEDPLGKRLKQGWPEWETPWREVVGVVADVKLDGVDADTPLHVFLPLAQAPPDALFLVVRTARDPASATRSIEQAMRELDRDVPVFGARTMDEVFAESIGPRRFPTIFLGQFSIAALVLAALGVFGLMAYAVAQRSHEVGVRMALGADGRRVVGHVMGEGLRVVIAGVLVGVAGALAATRLLRSLLFEVAPTDPAAFAAAVALLSAVALAAAYLPARRAARVDPAVALRAE